MSNDTSTGESIVATALTGALIALSIVLGIAFLAGTSPDMSAKAAAAASAQVEHVAVATTVHKTKAS